MKNIVTTPMKSDLSQIIVMNHRLRESVKIIQLNN